LRFGFIRVMMRRHKNSPSMAASQEGIMYVRIVRAQAPPGQVEELARRWQAFWGTQMPKIPGFRHAHFAAGPETNATISISVWEKRPDQATMEPLMEQFRTQVADISAGPPIFLASDTRSRSGKAPARRVDLSLPSDAQDLGLRHGPPLHWLDDQN
jgi:hypothetical protein